jgi:hypothetical protein
MSNTKSYFVITPNYDVYPAGEYEPAEIGADCIELETDSKTSAKRLAVKAWLNGLPHDEHRSSNYCLEQKAAGESPYAGITVKCFPDDFDDIVEEDEI